MAWAIWGSSPAPEPRGSLSVWNQHPCGNSSAASRALPVGSLDLSPRNKMSLERTWSHYLRFSPPCLSLSLSSFTFKAGKPQQSFITLLVFEGGKEESTAEWSCLQLGRTKMGQEATDEKYRQEKAGKEILLRLTMLEVSVHGELALLFWDKEWGRAWWPKFVARETDHLTVIRK